MNEIVNCPFCRSAEAYVSGNIKSFYVICNHCKAIGPEDINRERAIHAWNLSLEPMSLLVALTEVIRNHATLENFLKEKRSRATWQMAIECVDRNP